MLGGLYGDLPPPSVPLSTPGNEERNKNSTSRSQASSTTWSSSAKMAPPALHKPSHLFTAPPSVLRNQQSLGKSKTSQAAIEKSVSPVNAVALLVDDDGDSAVNQPALVGITATIVEEYDPARPNDYEEYRREKKRRMMEVEMKHELERRRQEEEERERERERELERERDAIEREKERDYESKSSSSLTISGEEAWKRRAAMNSGLSAPPRSPSPPTNGDGFLIGKSSTAGLGVGAGGQMTAAQKMMAKMGWKEGQGLGKLEQGITTPLMAKKTDRRAGVIVNASETRAEKKPKSVNMNGPPTRVLLLRNMVGPGQVDDELEGELAEECAKHGTVTRVLIFEITEPSFPENEAVRIFIQFERSEEATRAFIDLEGRYFGGRTVRASFYDEDRFSRNELAPTPDEISG